MSEADVTPVDKKRSTAALKIGLFLGVAGLGLFLYSQFGHYLNLKVLAEKESLLRQFQVDHPVLVYGIAFAVYVTAAGLSLPGAAALTLLFGWYFSFPTAFILVSFASTAGATVAFLMSRYFFRETIQSRFRERLQSFNKSLEQEGAFFLFSLRLIPAVPFFVINAVMGLTPLKTRTYWWVSQLGMLPGTAVYVYAGSSVPDLQTLADKGIEAVFNPTQIAQLLSAFVLLGLFPLIARFFMKKWKSPEQRSDTSTTE